MVDVPIEDAAAPAEPEHALYARVRRIQALPVPSAAKLILISIAQWGDWKAGIGRPGVETIARDASVTERHVQRLLRYLACRAGSPCIGDRACPHWGLIDVVEFARYGRATEWRLNLDPTRFQLAMPEVGVAGAGTLRPLERKGCAAPGGCQRAHHAKGLCSTHYKRDARRGDPDSAGRQPVFGSSRPRGVGLGSGNVENPASRVGEVPAPVWKEATG